MLVQPQLPRFVRVGDRFWPGGVPRVVEGPDGPARVELKLLGPVDGKATHVETVNLKSNKVEPVLTPVTLKSVPSSLPTVTVRADVTRLSDKAGDAFEVALPLYPDRTEEGGLVRDAATGNGGAKSPSRTGACRNRDADLRAVEPARDPRTGERSRLSVRLSRTAVWSSA